MFKLDVHTHTVASGHAYSTVLENVAYGKKNGMKVIGMSDHAPGLPGGTYIFFFQNQDKIPDYIDGVRVLKGVEANIMDYKGRLDMTDTTLSNLDYTIASLHPPCISAGSIVENTDAIIGAMANPNVKIIGHPDDARFPLDYKEIVKAAKAYNVLLEVNNSSLKPNGFRLNAEKNATEYLSLCAQENIPVIFGSDAHFAFDVGNFEFCEKLINKIGFDKSLVINESLEAFMKHIDAKM